MTSVHPSASAPRERVEAPAARLNAANLHEHVSELQTSAWMTAVVEPRGNFPPLADTSEQQFSLNTLTQRSLPALPYSTWKLDPVLLAPRLRFGPPAGGSPFRGPLDSAVLYAAPTKKAALMDMAHHRWRFLNDTSRRQRAFAPYRTRPPPKLSQRCRGQYAVFHIATRRIRSAVTHLVRRPARIDVSAGPASEATPQR